MFILFWQDCSTFPKANLSYWFWQVFWLSLYHKFLPGHTSSGLIFCDFLTYGSQVGLTAAGTVADSHGIPFCLYPMWIGTEPKTMAKITHLFQETRKKQKKLITLTFAPFTQHKEHTSTLNPFKLIMNIWSKQSLSLKDMHSTFTITPLNWPFTSPYTWMDFFFI